MKKKKNRFWLFLFSLMPGAGHMYMGFMRMGLSFMMGFMALVAVVNITGIDVLIVFPIVLYIYSFFHANNLGGLDDEHFAAVEDEYLFGMNGAGFDRFKLDKKNRNIAAVVLIVLGVSMLWNVGFGMLRDYVGYDNPVMKAIYYTMRDDVPRVVIAIAVIWFGATLLRGKKENVQREELMQEDFRQKDQVFVEGEIVDQVVVEPEHQINNAPVDGDTAVGQKEE